jgi:hypothetical protein
MSKAEFEMPEVVTFEREELVAESVFTQSPNSI